MTAPVEQVDAVIVGSGAAGSAFAARLAAGGKKVMILEAGPRRGNENLVSSAIWSRRLKWSGPPVLEDGANPVGHAFNAGYGIGGGALHHYGVWPRLHPEDFRLRSLHDRGLDWPFDYAELQPWYDRVQGESGIAGDAGQERWRPPGEAYPLPPVPVFPQGAVIRRGFEKRGLHTAPLPLAVNTRPFNGRAPCIWDGWCDAGCPIGALANPLSVDLPRATAHGAELRANATVRRVLTDASGGRASGVEYLDANGEARTVVADLVVLAAFAVQNPRLLLASATPRHPAGLANSSGLVGRFLMSHPGALIYGLFDEQTDCHLGATGGQLLSQDGYAKDTHARSGAFGSYQWMIAQAVKPNDLLGIATTRPDLFGAALDPFMQTAARHFATMTALVEDLPVADNQLRLDQRVDAFGVPLARVTHTTHPASKKLWATLLEEGKAIFEAAGAREVWTGPQAAMHIMGGTIMGKDPSSTVCNGYGQTHDLPNLVIAGPGVFPTSGGVNPTFTVHALVARSASYLLENWNAVIR
jgi:choline dehydrogenase-like flavoprotein